MDKGSRSQAAGVGGGVGQPGGQSAGAPAYNMAVISYVITVTFVLHSTHFCSLIMMYLFIKKKIFVYLYRYIIYVNKI